MAQGVKSLTGVVAANGSAGIPIGSGAQTWVVSQITTEVTGVKVGATSDLRLDGSILSRLLPGGDVAANGAIELRPGSTITLNWRGMAPGSTVKATIAYTDGTV